MRSCNRRITDPLFWLEKYFWFLVPFGIISLILINRKIKTEWAEAVGEKFDWRGSIVYGIALASFMYGFSRLHLFGGLYLDRCNNGTVIHSGRKNTGNPVFDIRLILRNRVFAFWAV